MGGQQKVLDPKKLRLSGSAIIGTQVLNVMPKDNQNKSSSPSIPKLVMSVTPVTCKDNTDIHILLVLPAIGEPHFLHKVDILKHNLRIILETASSNMVFHLDISCYKLNNISQPIVIKGESQDGNNIEAMKEYTPKSLIRKAVEDVLTNVGSLALSVKNVKIRQEKGILGQFLYKYIKPTENFDYIFMFLDDIKLTDSFKFDLLYDVYYLSDLNIISPALTTDSPNNYEYMLQIQQSEYDPSSIRKIRETSILEFYCYFMSMKTYRKYYETFLTENTRWMWGIDLALTTVGFRVGIYDYLTVQHFYQTINYKEQYGKHVAAPLDEKKQLNHKFEMKKYELIDTILI